MERVSIVNILPILSSLDEEKLLPTLKTNDFCANHIPDFSREGYESWWLRLVLCGER
jgi:hypothetical protein